MLDAPSADFGIALNGHPTALKVIVIWGGRVACTQGIYRWWLDRTRCPCSLTPPNGQVGLEHLELIAINLHMGPRRVQRLNCGNNICHGSAVNRGIYRRQAGSQRSLSTMETDGKSVKLALHCTLYFETMRRRVMKGLGADDRRMMLQSRMII